MLKALMKKQLMELNQSLFVNMKSGERKPRAKVILSITMFAVLMIVVIGGIFWQMAESMSPLIKAGAGWLYMLIMAAGVSGAGHLWKRVQYLCQPVQGKG